MLLIFPSQAFEGHKVDEDFLSEFRAAKEAGFETALYSLEEKRLLTRGVAGHALYRGWMMTTGEYADFFVDLKGLGVELLTTPEQYELCHHLPAWYSSLREFTPTSVWFTGPHYQLDDLKAVFEQGPLVLKDYVKSCKHYWDEACFIPELEASTVDRVVAKFLELRGDYLQGGLVFRRFLSLMEAGQHPDSGMPLTLELRYFVANSRVISCENYWAQGEYRSFAPPRAEWLSGIIKKIPSPFFTLDVACDKQGRWWVIEVGDGQVSGLPSLEFAESFYSGLRSSI